MEKMWYASLWKRAGAVVTDSILLLAIAYALLFFLPSDNPLFLALGIILILASPFLYFTFLEHSYGQTLGKRIFGIAVLGINGKKASLFSCFLRTLLRFADMLPMFYLVGAISILSTPKKQRLGDLVAQTVVVDSTSRKN